MSCVLLKVINLASERSISIHETVSMPVCTSCGKLVRPDEKAVTFYCPKCGRYEIIRCKKCRSMSVPYTCPACGFTGP